MKKSVLSLILIAIFNIYGFLSFQTIQQTDQVNYSNSQNFDQDNKHGLKDNNGKAENFFEMPFLFKSKHEVISVFYDLNVPQIDFAANKIKQALEKWNFRVELNPINGLTRNYSRRKIVIVKKDDTIRINVNYRVCFLQKSLKTAEILC